MGQYKTLPVCAESHKGRSVCFTNAQVLKLLLYSKPESLLPGTQECTGDINLANLSGPLAAGGLTPGAQGFGAEPGLLLLGLTLACLGSRWLFLTPALARDRLIHPSQTQLPGPGAALPLQPTLPGRGAQGGTVQRCPGDNRAGTATHAPGAAASLLCPCGNERLQWVTYKGM